MDKRIVGTGTGLGGICWWFVRGTVESWFFDKVLNMVNPGIWGDVVEYGPPAALFLLTAWLFIGHNRDKREEKPPPQPDIRIDDVVRRIIGVAILPKATEPESMAVLTACETLREKALLGHLDVFGGINWRTTRPADYDRMTRRQIPKVYWADHKIDASGVLGDEYFRGRTTDLKGQMEATDYHGIWFDLRQIENFWPTSRARIAWRWPITRRAS